MKTYYQALREQGRQAIWDSYGDYIITRPVDKRENFIKRCVAVAGDSLQVINGIVYVNHEPQPVFPQSERYSIIKFPHAVITPLLSDSYEEIMDTLAAILK